MPTTKRLSTFALLTLAVSLSVPVLADPPAHAKAHGWRAKHRGYTGYEWERDYGIESGRCDHRTVATVVGGIAGAAIANRVADGDRRVVATLIGAAAGALIGRRIGREIEKSDAACVGHALELARPGQTVSWTNASTGVDYRMTPGAERSHDGTPCREFSLMATNAAGRTSRSGVACHADAGVWELIDR